MHDTAYRIGGLVMAAYLPARPARILEIGAQNVNGTLRDHAPRNAEYTGLDFEPGNGVDIIITSLEDWGVPDAHFDLVMASSVFEHDKAFWNTFLAMCRKTRPGGHIYVSAPSNGSVHRYPNDHWRFYPDSGLALEDWAKSNGLDVTLIESFIAERETDGWNDFCAIFRAGPCNAELTTSFVSMQVPCTNTVSWRSSIIGNRVDQPEDVRLLQASQNETNALRQELEMARNREQAVREGLQQQYEAKMQNLAELHTANITEVTDETNRMKAEVDRLSAQAKDADMARAAAEKREQDCFTEIARLTKFIQQASKSEDLDAARADLEDERAAHAATEQRLQERFREIAALTRLIQERDQIIDHSHEQREWLRQVVSGLTRDLSRSWKSRLASLLPGWVRQMRQRKWLKQQGLFDGVDYAASYPDVALGSMDPLRHYVNHGMKEGRLIRRKH